MEGKLRFCHVVKTFFVWGMLLVSPVGMVTPVVAQNANLTKAPLKWPSIKSEMRKGHFDENVAAIQYLLRARGMYQGKPSGLFDARTSAAVKAFQRKNGLKVDGIAGPQTLPRLVINVKRGSQGDAVRAAQMLARTAGDELGETPNANLKADGVFGAKTEDAVKTAQNYSNEFEDYLIADGVMGPRSWCILLGGSVVGSQV